MNFSLDRMNRIDNQEGSAYSKFHIIFDNLCTRRCVIEALASSNSKVGVDTVPLLWVADEIICIISSSFHIHVNLLLIRINI